MPKLNIIIARPKSKVVKKVIINIRVKANVLLINLIRELGYLIL
jgi:hypothetical protein